MRPPPPPELVDLLTRLGLATPGEVRGMSGRVRRLTRELPAFEFVWVDALAQARRLTPFQAAEINAGRGDSLAVGPFVLLLPLPGPAYARTYRARRHDAESDVRLTIVALGTQTGTQDFAAALTQLEALIQRSAAIAEPSIVAIRSCGLQDDTLWVACPLAEGVATRGVTAQEWIVGNGRFPPAAVLEIARQMLAGLVACERADVVHGDLAAGQLWLDAQGQIRLPAPGLRALVRPSESLSHADLGPDVFDGLAPERIRDGTPPTFASDVFACGCLWWRLLTGRAPLAGATGLAKMRSALAARIPDVRELAPETPQPLAEAIAACIQRDPLARPQSFAALVEQLGAPMHEGQMLVARCVMEGARPLTWSRRGARPLQSARIMPPATVAVGGVLLILAVATWPLRTPTSASEEWPTGEAMSSKYASTAPQALSLRPLPERTDAHLASNRSATRADAAAIDAQSSTGTGPANDEVGPVQRRDSTRVAVGRSPIALATATRPSDPSPLAGEGRETSRLPSPQVGEGRERGIAADRVLELPAGRGVAWTDVRLQPGQLVRGPGGKRATVFVSRTGANVDVEDVHFQDVDFVFTTATPSSRPATTASDASDMAGIVSVRAHHCEFRGCTFRSATPLDELPAAIFWRLPETAAAMPLSRREGRLQLADCVVAGVECGVHCEGGGKSSIQMTNVLHLGPGPLVSLGRWPQSGNTVSLLLRQSTLRDASGLVECSHDEAPPDAGNISIRAENCALIPDDGHGLVVLLGNDDPTRLLAAIQLAGPGTVLVHATPLVEWRRTDGRRQVASDGGPAAGSFVRSALEFAGSAEDGPAASRVVRWQAPLKSSQPPGIGVIPLLR